MKTPNFIVIWKDRRGWFLCQDFRKIQDAIRAAEDGARRNAGDKKVPGQAFAKTLSNFSICAIPRRARFLLGDRLRKERWHRVSRAAVAPHLFAKNPEQARVLKALSADAPARRAKDARLVAQYNSDYPEFRQWARDIKAQYDSRPLTFGECARTFRESNQRYRINKEIERALDDARDALKLAVWTAFPGGPFPDVKRVVLPSDLRSHWVEVNYASYLAQCGIPEAKPNNPTLEVGNRISLDDLGKHTTPTLSEVLEWKQRPGSVGVSLHSDAITSEYIADYKIRTDRLVDAVTHADVDPKAFAQAMGRVLRKQGPPDVSWKDGSEADGIPLLPRVVEWFSGIVWNWDHVVYTALWWTVLALLATCFFLVLTF